MILKNLYDDKLAQASYLVGCEVTGEALVVDPNRDVQQYIDAAKRERLRITHVTETHIHADFVSGARELAERTGAKLYLSNEGDDSWKYEYGPADGAVLLRDGDTFEVGTVQVRVLHTPGHTPEHVSFVVTDTTGADQPMGVFTGDFVFVGDVGRPDLLERTAGVTGTMESGARDLFRSIQRIKTELPDFVQIWPGHGAGSACGKSLGAVPQSTLGYEKLYNWALATEDEAEFVEAVLSGQPEPPRYFAEMKRINKEGPPVRDGPVRPPRLHDSQLAPLLERGALVIDTRSAAEYATRNIPGTINVPLNRAFNTWAGWLVPYDRDFYLIAGGESTDGIGEAARDLAMIGLDRLAGYFTTDVLKSWEREGRELGSVRAIGGDQLAERMKAGSVEIVDVRDPAEWEAGHLPGAKNIPVGHLTDRLAQIPTDRPVVLHCQGGARSAIATSLLQSAGLDNVLNYADGYRGWSDAGYPVEVDDALTGSAAT